jgi:hypothetical protein
VHTLCYEATDNFFNQCIWLSARGCLVMPGNAWLQLGESYSGFRPEMKFPDINLTKDSSLLLYDIDSHSIGGFSLWRIFKENQTLLWF